MPAHQRLEADDPAGPEVDLRLIDQAQLALAAGAPQVGVEPDPGGRLDRQAMIEQLEAVAAARLGPVERGVGVAQQHVAFLPVGREHGDADARGDDTAPARRSAPARARLPAASAPGVTASSGRCRPGRMKMNSSPPMRATVSLSRRLACRRRLSATSSRSPMPCPRLSLTALNRSTSRNATATSSPVRAARRSVISSRSSNRRRFGSPVSSSWVAWSSIRSRSAFCRVTSRTVAIRTPLELAEQAHRHLRREAAAIAADPDHLGAGTGAGADGQLALGHQKLVDVTADHGRDVAAEDRGCGRVGDLHPRRRVQHHDAFAHGIHDRPQLLLALLQGELAGLGLGDVGVDADHAAVGQPRLADPQPAPVAQLDLRSAPPPRRCCRSMSAVRLRQSWPRSATALRAMGHRGTIRSVMPSGDLLAPALAEQLTEAPVAAHQPLLADPTARTLR